MDKTQTDYDSLRRIHESTNITVEKLEQELTKLRAENMLLLAKLANAQKALDINKDIMRNALTEQNKMQVEYGNERQELKAKIKKFKRLCR
jgi:hypothetical protein